VSGAYVERVQERSPNSILGTMLTVSQAAKEMGITSGALYQRLRTGGAPAHHRYGKRVMFKREDLA
jgi:excisionase family DNA binding protein